MTRYTNPLTSMIIIIMFYYNLSALEMCVHNKAPNKSTFTSLPLLLAYCTQV